MEPETWFPKVKGEAGRPPQPLRINIAVKVPESAAKQRQKEEVQSLLEQGQRDIIHRC